MQSLAQELTHPQLNSPPNYWREPVRFVSWDLIEQCDLKRQVGIDFTCEDIWRKAEIGHGCGSGGEADARWFLV